MDDVELQKKFPNMSRVSNSPPLFTLNGCGLAVYGRRDADRETRTYVKTYYLCFIFIPVLPICAYRVSDAPGGGWYFIGREPLSKFSRAYNWLTLIVVLSLMGASSWQSHIKSPSYSAQQEIYRADAELAEGKTVDAAARYSKVSQGSLSEATTAVNKLQELLVQQIPVSTPADAVKLCGVAVSTRQLDSPSVLKVALTRATLLEETDLRKALEMRDVLEPMQSNKVEHLAYREKLLEKIFVKEPQDIAIASELAVLYEDRKQLDKCKIMLTPLVEKLGSSEGARILGEIYFKEEGQQEAAFKLLSPYVDARLTRLHEVSSAYEKAYASAYDAVLADLNAGRAPQIFYQAVKPLPKAQQDVKVDEYIAETLRVSPVLAAHRTALSGVAKVVPLALDLGIIRVQRAHEITDPTLRRQELESAEKLFLAIRGLAGENPEYKLFYGQVLYWLGRASEGSKMFEDLLTSKQRDFETLSQVGRVLREVGDTTSARKIFEESYEKGKDSNQKQAAARMRSAEPTDLQDEIKWLQRADITQPDVAATLASVQGSQALAEGRSAEAHELLTRSANLYEKMNQSVATLNNAALVWSRLFAISHDRVELAGALKRLSDATALQPSNTILQYNYTGLLLCDATLTLISGPFDLKKLDCSPSQRLVRALYNDASGRATWVAKYAALENVTKAITILERIQIMAPRRIDIYENLFDHYEFTRNLSALRALNQRLSGVQLDEDRSRAALEFYKGTQEAQHRTNLTAQIARMEKTLAALPETDTLHKGLATAGLSLALMQARDYHLPVDYDRVVSLSEQACAAGESVYTCDLLIEALLSRTWNRMIAQDPLCASWEKSCGSALSSSTLLTYAAYCDPKRREAILHDADILRAKTLLKKSAELFPMYRRLDEVGLFQDDPDEFKKIVDLQGDEYHVVCREIRMKLHAFSAEQTVRAFLQLNITGHADHAQKLWDEAKRKGIPLPSREK
jgi:tetratricopeptide (TPR) repeat protein